MTDERLALYQSMPDNAGMVRFRAEVAKEFGYNKVEESNTLLNSVMNKGETPSQFGLRLESQALRAGNKVCPDLVLQLFMRSLPARMAEEIWGKLASEPSLKDAYVAAQAVYDRVQQAALYSRMLPAVSGLDADHVEAASAIAKPAAATYGATMMASPESAAILGEIKRLAIDVKDLKVRFNCAYCGGDNHDDSRCRIKNPLLARQGWEPKNERLRKLFYANRDKMFANHKRVTAGQHGEHASHTQHAAHAAQHAPSRADEAARWGNDEQEDAFGLFAHVPAFELHPHGPSEQYRW
jgi:hypothetical protein